MQLRFGDKGVVNRKLVSVVPVPEKKGKELSCPQIVTARIMMSRLCPFAGGLSEKKQEHTTPKGA